MVEEEPKTKDGITQLIKHLEDEHRKSNISDKTYKELKEKYKAQISYLENTVSDAAPQEEIEPEQASVATAPEAEEDGDKKKKGGGILGKLFKKKNTKDDKQEPAVPAARVAEKSSDVLATIEIEKIKTMMDAFRDQKKASDESVQSLFESVGEVRSMSIQNDANEREINSKLEKIDDEISQLKPKEIEKKINDVNETLEKHQITSEKLQAKSDAMSEKLNKLSESFKVIGNMENLSNINENVQRKLADIQEATNYTERLASKVEKIYIDLKMELEDIVIYKSKQEGLEDAMKDVLKTLDNINNKFENYTTKKDIESERQDIMILSKETEGLKNTLGLVQSNVPEPILRLRKEREDINIFLDSLDEQHKSGRITDSDYTAIKSKNTEKLEKINTSLENEWKNFEHMVEQGKISTELNKIKNAEKEDKVTESADQNEPDDNEEEGTKNDSVTDKFVKNVSEEEMISDIKSEMEKTEDDADQEESTKEPIKHSKKDAAPREKRKEKKKTPASLPF